ncbi:protein tyrosine phosphatase [Thalassospira profundimaris]|uniref:Protein tyrosine phosphatase n=1 Tax=Thalassospira profundimaris TaxID=502049 RepID=A0A367XGC4_9PROT|nr:protein-tyrosine-phosphatase [Thalassospira profundimaris]RCK52469.1 protein tyrosine phosphatase [Thalassospira profundimaris]
MESVSISLLTICGIEELPDHAERKVTHILSILDPERPDPETFGAYTPHERTVLRFHDIIEDRPGMEMPRRDHVEKVLAFGEELAKSCDLREDGHLLVHCHMGVSRSTASMVMLMAQAQPEVSEDDLFKRLAVIRPQAWPNSVMIAYADELLGRDGRFTEALRRHYGRQIERDPYFVTWMTELGRAREVDMAVSS